MIITENLSKIIRGRRIMTIIVFAFLFFLFKFAFAQDGVSISLFPESGSFRIGDEIKMDIKINAAGIPINASEVVLRFPPDNFEVASISKNGSIFSLWPKEPFFSNTLGLISFIGGTPQPGFSGEGNAIAVKLKAIKEGESSITFDEGKILANDGKGTNVLAFLHTAKYFIMPPG
ncbi:MAG: cohesin domain-containing protein, partial [Candidatus Parcubacteria bacterium]|nr:cohesin domain-containing protein [Candidatus Parcubacteria bacterium]